MAKVKNYNLNVTENLFTDFKNVFPEFSISPSGSLFLRGLKKPKKNDHKNVKRGFPTGIDLIGHNDYIW